MFGLLFFLLVNALSQDYVFEQYLTDSDGNFGYFYAYLINKCYSLDTAVDPTYGMASQNTDGSYCYTLYNDSQCSSVSDECTAKTYNETFSETVDYVGYVISGIVESNDVELTSDYKRQYFTDMCYQSNDRYIKVEVDGLNLVRVGYNDSSCTTPLNDTSLTDNIGMCNSGSYLGNSHLKTLIVCESGSITGIPLESSESEQESSSSVSSDIPQEESSNEESSNEQSSDNDSDDGTSMTNIFGAITLLFLLFMIF
ncbi:hypothetical protein QTN25_000802 [Entamoeba marina]